MCLEAGMPYHLHLRGVELRGRQVRKVGGGGRRGGGSNSRNKVGARQRCMDARCVRRPGSQHAGFSTARDAFATPVPPNRQFIRDSPLGWHVRVLSRLSYVAHEKIGGDPFDLQTQETMEDDVFSVSKMSGTSSHGFLLLVS